MRSTVKDSDSSLTFTSETTTGSSGTAVIFELSAGITMSTWRPGPPGTPTLRDASAATSIRCHSLGP